MPSSPDEPLGNNKVSEQYFYDSISSDPKKNIPMLSFTNDKMEPFIATFTISLSSCVGMRTVHCIKYCYGVSGNMQNSRPKARYRLNYERSRDPDFVYHINNQIQKERRKFDTNGNIFYWRVQHIRIHAIGDFYNNEYYMKWVEIALANPKVKFLAYTKNITIDFNIAPKNFFLKFSVDPSTTEVNPTANNLSIVDYVETFKRQTYGPNSGEIKIHLEAIDRGKVKGFMCRSKCKYGCDWCWTNQGNVIFPIKKKGVLIKLGLIDH